MEGERVGPSGEAFEDGVRPLLARARAVARRVAANPMLAEEAVQEALVRAYRFWGQRRGAEIWPWLRRLVVRECLRAMTRDAAGLRGVPPDVRGETPEEVALRREEREEVRRALERLPAGYRRVLVLRHGRGMTEPEVAAVLGLPLGTVKWRCKRAHDHLRQVLTRGAACPLAETLKEVTMGMHISVSAGPVGPNGEVIEKPAPRLPEVVSLAEATGAVSGFVLPEGFLERHGASVWLLREPGRPAHGVQVNGDGFSVTYLHFPGRHGLHLHALDGTTVLIDEPTRVGGWEGRWWQIDAKHSVNWSTGEGRLWTVSGALAPAEIRRIAEEVAAALGPDA